MEGNRWKRDKTACTHGSVETSIGERPGLRLGYALALGLASELRYASELRHASELGHASELRSIRTWTRIGTRKRIGTQTYPISDKPLISDSWQDSETARSSSFSNSTEKRVLKLLDLADLPAKSSSFNTKFGPFFSFRKFALLDSCQIQIESKSRFA